MSLAKALLIVPIITTALLKRLDMIHFFAGTRSTFSETVSAQRLFRKYTPPLFNTAPTTKADDGWSCTTSPRLAVL